MASSSRTDSWPRNGAHEGGGPHHNCAGVDHNQNKRGNHVKTNPVERKHSDGDHVKGELAKLRKDWSRLQQENMVRIDSICTVTGGGLCYLRSA